MNLNADISKCGSLFGGRRPEIILLQNFSLTKTHGLLKLPTHPESSSESNALKNELNQYSCP